MYRSGGFALVTAIFLLAVLATVSVYFVDVIATEHQGAALDITGSRAYQAARAGIEWGAYSILKNPSGSYAASCRTGSATRTIDFSGYGLHATVTCTSSAHSEAGESVQVYRIRATSCNQAGGCPGPNPGSPDYVERQIEAIMSQ